VELLEAHDDIHVVAPGVDLRYKVGGRKWINGSGTFNIPDGEVFTGPIENSVNGTIHFGFPAVYKGVRVEDVTLCFRHGRVVEASASKGYDFLVSMLDTDDGARQVGEVAFGLNAQVKRFTGNTLFDEKIDGTMHLALGKSPPDTGGKNRSAIHWDIVADLRQGEVYAENELCYRDGRFIEPDSNYGVGAPTAEHV
jgi:aminopeptidase